MGLSVKMDEGPIFAQAKIGLDGKETKQELADKLLALGTELLIKQLPAILQGSVEPTPQDDNLATYTSLIKKADGLVDFGEPADQLEREVRELRRANEILKKASAYFAQAELDRRVK